MSKHIVIISGSYGKYMSPGGNIVSGIIEELAKEYSVTLVSHKDHFGEAPIKGEAFRHELVSDYATCFHHYCLERIHSSNKVVSFFFYVLLKAKQVTNVISMHCRKYGYSETLKRKTKKKIDNIMQTKRIDVLIGVSEPHDAVAAVCEYKEKHKDILTIIYQLDRFANGNSLYKYKLLKKRAIETNQKKEFYFLSVCDACFVLPPIAPHYENRIFNEVRKKIEVTEHPLVRVHDMCNKVTVYNRENVIVYAGSLDKTLRNPEFWLQLYIKAAEIDRNMPLFRCFSFGNCEEIIMKYSKLSDQKVQQKGKVMYSQIEEEYGRCSYILILGNNSREEIPSKVFDCISYGKGIIYLYYYDDDPVLPYLRKYPIALTIKMDFEKLIYEAQRLCEFCEICRQYETDEQQIIRLYKECTPQYVTQQFKNIIR